MKRIRKTLLFITLIMILETFLTACGNSQNTDPNKSSNETKDTALDQSDSLEKENGSSTSENSRVLITFFTVPEDADAEKVDAVASASIVIDDSKAMGNTEYVSATIQQAIGGDLFQIETTEDYPRDHDALVDQAANEQEEDARPKLSAYVKNLEQYDTIILGFPNWWWDLPMPVYTFLEEHDLSGKKIIPFVTHGGSGFSNTTAAISKMQPEAEVLDNGISLSREDVADSADEVREWALNLGVN